MRAPGFPLFLLALLVPIPAVADPGGPVPAIPVAILGFVALVAWGIGRYAAALRADFFRLAADAPPADRLAAFRDSPAGLPDGSVRAALAVAIVLLCLPALVLSQALGLAGTGELGTILGGVIGFYFGSRGAVDPPSRRADASAAPAPATAPAASAAGPASATLAAAAAVAQRAGTVLDSAARAAPAVEAAFRHADAPSLAAALAAASQAVEEAGDAAGLPPALHQVLRTAQAATEAAAAVETALAAPPSQGGLAEALAPVLRAFGGVPGLALGPVGIAGGLLLGAWQAAVIGKAHHDRWMARVLDRPVPPELLPAGAWDGEAARALLSENATLAEALADRLAPGAPEQAAAAALARLLEPDGAAWLRAEHPALDVPDAEAAVAALRRLVLDGLLDAADHRPVVVAGTEVPQAALRADLDRLRGAGAGSAVQALGRLAGTLSETAPAEIERALAEAAR